MPPKKHPLNVGGKLVPVWVPPDSSGNSLSDHSTGHTPARVAWYEIGVIQKVE